MKTTVRIASNAHDGHPFRTVTVGGLRIGRIKQVEIMGFDLWVWTPGDNVAPAAKQIARSVPAGKQFGSIAEIRRHFRNVARKANGHRTASGTSTLQEEHQHGPRDH